MAPKIISSIDWQAVDPAELSPEEASVVYNQVSQAARSLIRRGTTSRGSQPEDIAALSAWLSAVRSRSPARVPSYESTFTSPRRDGA